jgi:hypothetical protein
VGKFTVTIINQSQLIFNEFVAIWSAYNMKKIRVLLTVPHFSSSASPYREMMAIAKYLPKDEFELVICSLRKNGIEETGPKLDLLGVPYFTARYRIKKLKKNKKLYRSKPDDQRIWSL